VHPNSKTQVVITNSSKKKKRTRKRKRITAQSAKATQADAFIYTEDQTTNQNDNNKYFTGDVACAGDYQWLRHRFRQPQRCNKALASEKTWAAASYSEAEPD
jgi:hypothetical protein